MAVLGSTTDDSADEAEGATIDVAFPNALGISSYGVVTNALGICPMFDTTTSITKSGKLRFLVLLALIKEM